MIRDELQVKRFIQFAKGVTKLATGTPIDLAELHRKGERADQHGPWGRHSHRFRMGPDHHDAAGFDGGDDRVCPAAPAGGDVNAFRISDFGIRNVDWTKEHV